VGTSECVVQGHQGQHGGTRSVVVSRISSRVLSLEIVQIVFDCIDVTDGGGGIVHLSLSLIMDVPYTEFVIADSLSIAVRSRGLNSLNNTPVYTPTNPLAQFDSICEAVAKLYGCNLYLADVVRDVLKVYNYDPINPDVFVERGPDSFFAFDDGDDPQRDKSTYVRYAPLAAVVSNDLEELEETPRADDERISTDFSEEALGWYYDVSGTDPSSPYSVTPRNVFAAERGDLCLGGEFNMIVQCPRGGGVSHVLGYSAKGLVTFPRSTLHTDKLRTPLLHVPHGYGVCLLAGVREIFILDSTFTPVLSFEFIPQFVSLVDGLGSNNNNKLAVIDKPLVSSLEELLDDDIASKYRRIKVGEDIVHGECSYSYVSPDRGGVPQTSTLRHMVSRWGVTKPVLCTPGSVLCMNLDTLERIITVVAGYIPEGRSVLYTTIERFVNFLYRTGHAHGGGLPLYETLSEAFVAYQNIKIINSQLASSDGNLTIDLSPFNNSSETINIENWRETKSMVLYQ
jgi:hypothetical protein